MNEKKDEIEEQVNIAGIVVNDLYDLIEDWKKQGLSEVNILKALIAMLPQVVIDNSPDVETAHDLLNSLTKKGEESKKDLDLKEDIDTTKENNSIFLTLFHKHTFNNSSTFGECVLWLMMEAIYEKKTV